MTDGTQVEKLFSLQPNDLMSGLIVIDAKTLTYFCDSIKHQIHQDF